MSQPTDADEPTQTRAELLDAALAGWQRDLAELGGRNALLWYRDLPDGTLDLTNAHPGGVAMLLAGRPTKLSDLFREATVLRDAGRRARTVRAATLELLRERGIRAGYLAVGMASWDVAPASRRPAAPVLLRRCELRPRDPGQEDFDLVLDRAVELNPALEHYLSAVRGVALDARALAAMATVRGTFDAQPVLAALGSRCSEVPGFTVSRRLLLATFATSKLPMVADLSQQREQLARHPVVAALAGDAAAQAELRSRPPVPRWEPDGDPREEGLVLDADSAQQQVVHAVRAGASLVLDSPPGTGRTQTVANLVAALVGDGKRVLLASQQRAGLTGVFDRLGSVGLRDLVLDAGEAAADPAALSRQLRRVLDQSAPAGPSATARPGEDAGGDTADSDAGALEQAAVEVENARRSLTDHVAALHGRREPWGVSAYEAQLALARLREPIEGPPPSTSVRLVGAPLRRLHPRRREEVRSLLLDVAGKDAWPVGGRVEPDPWHGARVTSAQEAEDAHARVTRLSSGALTAARRRMGDTLHEAGLPTGRSVADWDRSLRLLAAVQATLETFRPEVYDVSLGDLIAATADKGSPEGADPQLGSLARRRLRGQARALLRPGPVPADLHQRLRSAADERAAWEELSGSGARPVVPADLNAAVRAHAEVAPDLDRLAAHLRGTDEGGDLSGMALDDLQSRLTALAAQRHRLDVVPLVVEQLTELAYSGLAPLVEDLARRRVPPEQVSGELDLMWWASVLEEVVRTDPRYGGHDGNRLRDAAARYAAADRAVLAARAATIRRDVISRVRQAGEAAPEAVAALREAAAGTGGSAAAFRDLVRVAADPLLVAATPCWAMSPLVVAATVPPGSWFDVVVLDESSQLGIAESLSAISRAAQVVVLGDRAQLPPVPFSVAVEPAAGAPWAPGSPPAERPARRQSILDALVDLLPVHRLSTDHRSRDERLIEPANVHVYGGQLLTYPGTGPGNPIDLMTVDGLGAVEPGRDSIPTTTGEVDAVVDIALAHARRSDASLAVVTLTARHAEAVRAALRQRLRAHPECSAFLADGGGHGGGHSGGHSGEHSGEHGGGHSGESFLVADVDRAQGLVRDRVILSVGYGRTPSGRVLHTMDVLDVEDGERRLGVALTRSRSRTTIVSAFGAVDLDPSRLRSPAALVLRDVLETAGAPEGERAVSQQLVRPAGEVLMADLARRLRVAGHAVAESVGASSEPLDLVVQDPQRGGGGLVVESDGPAYAAVLNTRVRSRLRQERLERLGWRYARVWSTDLFRDPAGQAARIEQLLAQSAPDATVSSAPPEPGPSPSPSPSASPSPSSPSSSSSPLQQTRDDTDVGWGESREPGDDAHDRWLHDQRPPHWD